MELNHTNHSASEDHDASWSRFPRWLKVGAIAAASAALGGLAAAWFYRGTLQKLQSEELSDYNSNFSREIPSDDEGF